MKTLLILVTLFAFVNLARAATEENDIFSTFDRTQSPTPYIKEFIEKNDNQYSISKQFNNTCPKLQISIINDTIRAFRCFKETDPNLTICGAFRSRFVDCVTPLITTADQCLPEVAKGTPMLIVNCFLSLVNHVCNLDGERVFEMLNPCIQPDSKNSENLNVLVKKVNGLLKDYHKPKNEVSVQDICDFGRNVETIWNEYVNKSCTNQFTRDVFVELYRALRKPCLEINKQTTI